MLQSLEFCTAFVYSPHGQSQQSERSRRIVGGLKRGDPNLISQLASIVQTLCVQGQLENYLDDSVTLVPVPRSAPLVQGGLWVPHLVALELRKLKLAQDVVPLLQRTSPVKKAAFSMPSERPTVRQHYESLRADRVRPKPANILLIDDVVTQGCTLLAAATRVSEQYPQAQVRALAVVRTMSSDEVDTLLPPVTDPVIRPCTGTIQPRKDRAVRRP